MARTDRVFALRMSRLKRPKITKALVDRVMARHQGSWREFVTLVELAIHWKVAQTLLLARHTCRADILDVIQMTLAALVSDDYRLIKAWDPTRASFETYSGLIAGQKAFEFLRQQKDVNIDDIVWSEPEAQTNYAQEERFATKELLQKGVETLIAELSPLGRRLVQLLLIEERTTDEVSAITNMKPGAVEQWRSRLLRRLREILQLLGGGR